MWWDILGVNHDADAKTIKLAYARLLKVTRPDENPEGFKALHAAYKEALAWLDHSNTVAASLPFEPNESSVENPTEATPQQQPQEVFESPPSLLILTEHTAPPELTQITLAAPPPVETEQLHTVQLEAPIDPEFRSQPPELTEEELILAKDWQQFLETTSRVLHTQAAQSEVYYWQYLSKIPSMVDLEFKANASRKLFAFIAEANALALEKKTLYIKPPVLDYLNHLFGWEHQWQTLTDEFGSDHTDAVLAHLSTSTTPTPTKRIVTELYYWRRMLAFAIDVTIYLVLILILGDVSHYLTDPAIKDSTEIIWLQNSMILIGIFYLVLGLPLLEASKWQGSIGKRLVGLKVINRQSQRLNILHAIWRHYATLICVGLGKITVFINLYFAYKHNALVQDWLSRSFVVLRKNTV